MTGHIAHAVYENASKCRKSDTFVPQTVGNIQLFNDCLSRRDCYCHTQLHGGAESTPQNDEFAFGSTLHFQLLLALSLSLSLSLCQIVSLLPGLPHEWQLRV